MNTVLIVGAGPVGLVMACELKRHGIACRIIDKLPAPSPFCRALGVTPRTLEVWDDMGIAHEAIDAGLWLDSTRVEIEGKPTRDDLRDLSDLPFAALSLPQNETERILTRHLHRLGLEIERSVTLTEAVTESEGVKVTLIHATGETEQASFRYVIGCDGAHSVVRKAAGIAFEGEAMPYDFMLGDVRVEWDLPRGLALRAMHPIPDAAPDFFIAIPMPEPQRYRVSMMAPPELSASGGGTEHGLQLERPAPTLAQLQTVADRVVASKPQLSDLRWSSLFRISMRLAARYREGNLFLAGDAAHIHPPTGGQGMNTGIQDAYNLAWKMALVLKQAAHPALLESYELERRTEGADVLARTIAATQGIANRQASHRLEDTQILVSYRGVTVFQDEPGADFDAAAPVPGDRAPDVQGLMRHGVGFPFRLFDLLRGTEHVLLIDAGQEAERNVKDLDDLAQKSRREFGHEISSHLRLVVISEGPGVATPPPGIASIGDAHQVFRKAYFTQSGNAYLIRPDGHISWRGASAVSPALMAHLRTIFTPHLRNISIDK